MKQLMLFLYVLLGFGTLTVAQSSAQKSKIIVENTPPSGFDMTKVILQNDTGTYHGYDYELWKDTGDLKMILGKGGAFNCSWDNANSALFRTGKRLGSTKTYEELGDISINYGCDYHPVGSSYLTVYGWSVDPLVEYYIVEAWGDWRPPGAVSKGTVEIDGGTYDIYETTRTNKPSIKGDTTFQQYWSVRTDKKTSGTISVGKHFKAWEAMGMKLGKMYEVALCVEGYQSRGTADVYKFDLSIGGETLGASSNNAPLFKQFTYLGDDRIYKDFPLKSDEFYTPILQGCYPDPSITRKGNDYYLVCSSFVMVPGVPIFHSTDLVNWQQLGHVLDRPSQLKVQDAGISAGIYAPQIRYNPDNDTFYMITTHIAAGLGNMVVKTKDPAKGWSDPIKLQFDGIDPSFFFDDDGKAYVVHNDAPDSGKELYEGHRVIKIWDYDTDKDRIIPGTDKIIVDGGVDITQKPIWIEAPHIYKKNGKYYLMCAEGGTSSWHSEVIFMSDNPKGPYIPAGNNPILTQRYFPINRQNKVDWAGHADLVEGPDGKYYGVFLAVRPNEKDRVNIGRETFMLPVDWSGEFPVFENGLIPLSPKLKMPQGITNKTNEAGFFPNGNFMFIDDFTSETSNGGLRVKPAMTDEQSNGGLRVKPAMTESLDYRWIGVRGWREDFVSLSKDGLRINPFPVNIKEAKPTSTLFYRQQHNSFEATATMDYQPASDSELAGIVCYQSESFNYVFGVTKKDNDDCIVLVRTERKGRRPDAQTVSTVIASEKIDTGNPVKLQVQAQGDDYRFNYAVGDGDFKNLGGTVSGDILSTNVAGGFTGSLIGLYATSANE